MNTQLTEENPDKKTNRVDATKPQKRVLAIPDHKRAGSIAATAPRLLRWLWLLPILFLVGFSIAHELLNRSYRGSHGAESSQNIIEVQAEGQLLQHTGSWSWRFFSWGVRTGTATTIWVSVMLDLGVPFELARASDILNPTPFLLFIFSLLFPIVGYFVTRGSSDAYMSGDPPA